MDLTVTKRTPGKKSENKRIRREGNIPATLYSQGKAGEEIVVEGAVFQKVLNKIEPGTLSTKLFTLHLDGKTRRAIVKDIQYDIITYAIIHLDFEQLHDQTPVNVNVPIQHIGAMDCIGVKLGGVLRSVIRKVKVRCLPKDIPSHFEVDVKDLGVNDSRRLSDIAIPKEVRPLINLKEIAVVVSKR